MAKKLEAKETALNQAADWKCFTKLILDGQEIELISAAIGQSYSKRSNVTLTAYDAFQCRNITGTVKL